MAVCYVNGGASGGIEKVQDDAGNVWFDARATKALKKAGYSQLGFVAGRFTVSKEGGPYLHQAGITSK